MTEFSQNSIGDEKQKTESAPDFFRDRATFLLRISEEDLSLNEKREIAEEMGLTKKTDFHLTIIGSATGKEILKKDEVMALGEKELLDKVELLCKETDFQITLKNEFYLIEKKYENENDSEIRKSIVQMADIEDLSSFYKDLSSLLGQDLKLPLPHVTLYTTSTNEENKLRGIGVYSAEQFETLKPKKLS